MGTFREIVSGGAGGVFGGQNQAEGGVQGMNSFSTNPLIPGTETPGMGTPAAPVQPGVQPRPLAAPATRPAESGMLGPTMDQIFPEPPADISSEGEGGDAGGGGDDSDGDDGGDDGE